MTGNADPRPPTVMSTLPTSSGAMTGPIEFAAVRAPSTLRRMVSLAGVLALRGAGTGVSFLVNVVVGRLLGPAGVGVFSVYNSILRVLEAIFGLGLTQYNLRCIAACDARGDFRQSQRVWWTSQVAIAAVSLACVACIWPLANLLAEKLGEVYPDLRDFAMVLRWGALSAGLLAMVRTQCEALKGRGFAQSSLAIEFLAAPALHVACIGFLWWWTDPVTIRDVLITSTLSFAIVLVPATIVWRRSQAALPETAPAPSMASVFSPRAQGAFLVWNLLNTAVWAIPYVVLFLMSHDEAEVGRFGAAHRSVSLASVVLVALSSRFSPRFARLHAQADRRALRSALLESQVVSLLGFAPLFVVLVLCPGFLLRMFGEGFGGGAGLMCIMAWGQLVNSAAGLSAEFLHMTHHEELELAITAGAVALVTILSIVLVRNFGATGAAWSFGVVMAVRKIASYAACWIMTRPPIVSNVG